MVVLGPQLTSLTEGANPRFILVTEGVILQIPLSQTLLFIISCLRRDWLASNEPISILATNTKSINDNWSIDLCIFIN